MGTLTEVFNKTMIESLVSAAIAVVTGGFVLTGRINKSLHLLDRRVDEVELRMASEYATKQEFTKALDRFEAHMVRIEEKLDTFIISK